MDIRTLLREGNFICRMLRSPEIFLNCRKQEVNINFLNSAASNDLHIGEWRRAGHLHRPFSITPCIYPESLRKERRVIFLLSSSLSRNSARTNEAQFLQNCLSQVVDFGSGIWFWSLMLLQQLKQEKSTPWIVCSLVKGWPQLCIAEGSCGPSNNVLLVGEEMG